MVITSKTPQPIRPGDPMQSERDSVTRLLAKASDHDHKLALASGRVTDIVVSRLIPCLSLLRAQLEQMRVMGLDVDNLILAAEQSVSREFGALAVDLGTILNLGEKNRDEELAADTEEAALFERLPHMKLEKVRNRMAAKQSDTPAPEPAKASPTPKSSGVIGSIFPKK